MRDMERLCEIIEEELGKIADKGLNTGNLETAYKLIDMYKDMKNTKYWDTKAEYYMAVLSEMQGGNSYNYSMAMDEDGHSMRRHRDSMGRYAREDGYDRGNSYGGNSYNYDRNNSMRGRGYSMNGGDEDYQRYMDSKRSYRSGEKSADCKQRMIDALERHMDKLTEEIGELSRDADCGEERQVLQKYISKLRNMM